ncbi:WD40-repeat-containing domain protein [Naviculisporaceae sp. PSN 640]
MSAKPDVLSPRQKRRRRQALSSPAYLSTPLDPEAMVTVPPCMSASPADSGYGSAESSPANLTESTSTASSENQPARSSNQLWMLGDGNGSEDLIDGSPSSEDSEERPRTRYLHRSPSPTLAIAARRMGAVTRKQQPHTLPLRSGHSRPRLPDSFVSDPITTPTQRRSNIGPSRASTSSVVRAYDRFIPYRTQSTDTLDRYKTGKGWKELTPKERILRHNDASEDAFVYRPRVVTPMASDYRQQSRSDGVPSPRVGSVLGPLDQNTSDVLERVASNGTVWAVGGLAPGGTAVDNGRGQLVRSSTNARLFRTSFRGSNPRRIEDSQKHEDRLAAALGLDRAQRTLDIRIPSRIAALHPNLSTHDVPTQWNGAEWVKEGSRISKLTRNPKSGQVLTIVEAEKITEGRTLPAAPFKVLDAPNLRDDFYCSILAYTPTCKTLAVGLGDMLYGWSETGGVKLLHARNHDDAHLTSIDFSSAQGGKAILAFGRSNRTLGLMSLLDDPDPDWPNGAMRNVAPMPRFEVDQPGAVTCLRWRPTTYKRPSLHPHNPGREVDTEDLLVGEDGGNVYYFVVEWPEKWEVSRDNWGGAITLIARISIHTQQICGLSWSPSGDLFATGGNDNLCCLYDVDHVLMEAPYEEEDEEPHVIVNRPLYRGSASPDPNEYADPRQYTAHYDPDPPIRRRVITLGRGTERYRWAHGAAVKAIAFCPWQEGLVATGGGSNDKCIHFFHTTSGAALATISVSAQVTSLIWSTTRREIAATFGYAAPEHSVRIAVFSWPECRQVAAIPWNGEHRALYAIPYPGGPDDVQEARTGTQPRASSRTAMEGCIMVASSDKSVKFHEVWSADKKAATGGVGMLGGSDILESLEGIDKEGDIIR